MTGRSWFGVPRSSVRFVRGGALILAAAILLIEVTLPAHAGTTTSSVANAAAPTKRPQPAGPGALTIATPTSPSLVSQGRALFDQSCASCHGLTLHGRTGVAPSLRGVGAGPADFYLSTGRMPLANPRDEPTQETPAFDSKQMRAIVAYIKQVAGGPPSPDADPAKGSLSLGFKLFDENCAGCHSIVARGGITVGAAVPDLQQVTPQQVAEAVRMGPYLMPSFSASQLDQDDLNSLARYIVWTRHPDNAGGWGIYNIGPIPEGIVAWFIGLLALVIVARLIGERTS